MAVRVRSLRQRTGSPSVARLKLDVRTRRSPARARWHRSTPPASPTPFTHWASRSDAQSASPSRCRNPHWFPLATVARRLRLGPLRHSRRIRGNWQRTFPPRRGRPRGPTSAPRVSQSLQLPDRRGRPHCSSTGGRSVAPPRASHPNLGLLARRCPRPTQLAKSAAHFLISQRHAQLVRPNFLDASLVSTVPAVPFVVHHFDRLNVSRGTSSTPAAPTLSPFSSIFRGSATRNVVSQPRTQVHWQRAGTTHSR